MSERFDAVIIGGGAAGLSSGALLASEGKKVLVLERGRHLGGRGLATEDEGFTVQIGSHLLEDPGSGLTRIVEHVGGKLEHGDTSSDMPVWDHERNRWGSIRDRYGTDKNELKKVITALLDTPWEALDDWDDRPLRDWIKQYSSHEGVIDLFEFIAVLECLTDDWWDHSASDNLYTRKLHYGERHTAAYSCWPVGGWDNIWLGLADAIRARGGEVRLNTGADRVLIENHAVVGVALPRTPRVLPNEVFEDEVVETDCVISTMPVWNVLNVVPEWELPDWYSGQIRYLAQDKFRVAWVGLYLAVEEPVAVIDRQELATWLKAPITGKPGYMFEVTAMDPSTAPEGIYLYCMGAVIPGAKGRDRRYLLDMLEKHEQEAAIMWPGLENHVWRRRHLVFDPSFGVIQKPGLVGKFRPHWRAPTVDGLYFASETFRSRGVGTDRAARAALTVVEDILGKRLPGFEDTWRY